jgi:hypothetical protein
MTVDVNKDLSKIALDAFMRPKKFAKRLKATDSQTEPRAKAA